MDERLPADEGVRLGGVAFHSGLDGGNGFGQFVTIEGEPRFESEGVTGAKTRRMYAGVDERVPEFLDLRKAEFDIDRQGTDSLLLGRNGRIL